MAFFCQSLKSISCMPHSMSYREGQGSKPASHPPQGTSLCPQGAASFTIGLSNFLNLLLCQKMLKALLSKHRETRAGDPWDTTHPAVSSLLKYGVWCVSFCRHASWIWGTQKH